MFSSSSCKISPEDRIKTLALSRVKGIGPRIFERLISHFECIGNIFEVSIEEISQVVGFSLARVIKSKKLFDSTREYLNELADTGIFFKTVLEEDYPSLLREISDPPIILYYKGDFREEDFKRSFAVVGTRNSTRYGEEITKRLVEGLIDAGFTIVSGMAFGIDKLAHEAVIDGGGRTIAVLSGRVDEPSPRSNSKIYEKIMENGCVVSETHLDTEVIAGMFPPRNRIISGLSFGTLIVEAGEKSGALITARLALEQDREVFAVPGSVFNKKSVGTNNLIQRGEAKLVQKVEDILEEFGFKLCKKSLSGQRKLSPTERGILDVLIQGPLCLDEISCLTGIEISRLAEVVAMMELEKKLAKVEGNRYVILN